MEGVFVAISAAYPRKWDELGFPFTLALWAEVRKPELILNGTPAISRASSSLFRKSGFMFFPDPGKSGLSNSDSLKCFNSMPQRKPKKIFQKFLPFFLKKFAEIKSGVTFVASNKTEKQNEKSSIKKHSRPIIRGL